MVTYGLRRAVIEGERECEAKARQLVERNLYVNNGLVSLPTEKGLKDLALNTDLPPMQRSLGVSWDVSEDVFTFQVAVAEKPYTKCGLL